jgi:hypothetical protein
LHVCAVTHISGSTPKEIASPEGAKLPKIREKIREKLRRLHSDIKFPAEWIRVQNNPNWEREGSNAF